MRACRARPPVADSPGCRRSGSRASVCVCVSAAASQPEQLLELARRVLLAPGVVLAESLSPSVVVRLAEPPATLSGERAVDALASWRSAWEADERELQHESRWELERLSALSPSVVSASWTAYWVPASVLPFVRLARRFNLRVKYSRSAYDQVSVFSWGVLFSRLAAAFRSGELALPHAAVSGRTEMVFEDGKIVRISESLDLAPQFRSQRVRNRRVARDHADFLAEWRRAPGTPLGEWDDAIRDALSLNSVPGMRPLDIDGLEPEVQSSRLEAVGGVLLLATLTSLFFGVSAATLRAKQIRGPDFGEDDEPQTDAGSQLRSRRLIRRAQQQQ